jgi:SAM-dependent methyltransferase
MQPTNSTDSYFMEDRREAGRLRAKVDPARWVRAYIEPLLNPGAEVLEVGCGPGALAAAVAELPERAKVTGIDRSARRLSQQVKPPASTNLQLKVGDANALPFANDSFDLVYSRFMLQYLPTPEIAIAEMLRVLKPGGQLLLQDLDGQLVWHDGMGAELEQGLTQVIEHLAKSGFDPHVGRKLFGLAGRAGLKNMDLRVEPYHLIVGQAPDQELELWRLKLDIARPEIRKAIGEEVGDQLIEGFLGHLANPETMTYSNVMTLVGQRA